MKRPLILALATAVTLTAAGCTAMNQQTMTCTITAKESVNLGGEHGNQYRVYTNECGTLTVSDSLAIGRLNSADLYGQLEPGGTYRMETGGYRIGIASQFPNIITATKENTP